MKSFSGLLCFLALAGALASTTPVFAQTAAPAKEPTTHTLWNAIATASWTSNQWRNGVQRAYAVASFVEHHWSQAEAEAAALRDCKKQGGVRCKVQSWSRGCGFVTTGVSSRGAGFEAGANPEELLRRCKAKGLRCDPPRGACFPT
ncbi:MAG: DUF4189 domain-containing protein [Patescibacteria group bacterium]